VSDVIFLSLNIIIAEEKQDITLEIEHKVG
jgi:hypothetical protein